MTVDVDGSSPWVVTPVGPGVPRDYLQKAIDSVAEQDMPCCHVVVFDGVGDNQDVSGDIVRIQLPEAARDIGSTPRTVGALYAWGQGASHVAFLDADNWFDSDHVSHLVAHQRETGLPAVASGRYIHDESGERFGPCPEQVPGAGFFDTSTFLFSPAGKGLSLVYGVLKPEQHMYGDRVLSQQAIKRGISCTYRPTMHYRSNWLVHYRHFGWPQDGVSLK